MKHTIIFAMRILAIPCIVLGFLLVYDVFIGSSTIDTAIVLKKSYGGSRSHIYYVDAQGAYYYRESIPNFFFQRIAPGDTIRLTLTPLCMEWRKVGLIKQGVISVQTTGGDIVYQALFGLLFMLTSLVFLPIDGIKLDWQFYMLFVFLEAIGVLLCGRLALVLLGIIKKM